MFRRCACDSDGACFANPFAYFEALLRIVRHSNAARLWVWLRIAYCVLRIEAGQGRSRGCGCVLRTSGQLKISNQG